MNNYRLHAFSRRKRQAHLKKYLLCAVMLVVTVCLSAAFGSSFAAARANTEEHPAEYKYYKSIEINGGDTLWSIAEQYADEHYSSIYDYIYELREMNHLKSDAIHAGQYLTIAYYDTEFR